ncbi:hypothetical protein [Hymenobacter fodinae]|uniref:Uncharacterized protein n=1 Tax=Hymenobacter fodinae TaxID=2510796 RepID=A0A4Z0P9X5_9BACT|nr:hypothetical protein [Hymenobacter fodinae]TGE09262.1 hypothetical protein EU556_00035 [Hymenobacter fodinae]
MNFSTLKDTYLRKLGFVRLSLYRSWDYPVAATEAEFSPATDMRYQHQLIGRDGTRLYVCSWIHEPGYMLTTAQHVSSLAHVVAELDSDDVVTLQNHIEAFFLLHGGGVHPNDPGSKHQLMLS